jgi:phosphoribosylformimino-5-aminoimidazole carboxamide ribonucleotide (ProFAR) isomerase
LKVLPTLQIQNGCSISHMEGGEEEPAQTALARLLDLGCTRMTFVDVDAARGRGNNRDLIAALIHQCRGAGGRVCIQVGGGIRGSDQAQFFLDHGATWLLIGTIIYKSPMVVDQLLARFHEHLTASIDSKCGEVHRTGWTEKALLSPVEVAALIRNQGFKRALFVDIPTDDRPEPDFAMARLISESVKIPLFMWSNFRHAEDLNEAAKIPGLQGIQVDPRLLLRLPAGSFSCNQEDRT